MITIPAPIRRFPHCIALATVLLTLPVVARPSAPAIPTEAYTWRNVPIVAGGLVPGLVFHPREPGLLYARTDVGGAYRYLPAEDRWLPLQDATDRSHWQWNGVASLALDPQDPDRLYLAAGSYPQIWGQPGALLRSNDRGASWETFPLPFKLPGNADGRNTGERLLVQPDQPHRLWLGTPDNGLWRSDDRGATWGQAAGLPDAGITTVWALPATGVKNGAEIWVALTAPNQPPVWRSTDQGRKWQPLSGQPTGLLVHQTAVDADGSLYVTYGNALGPNGVTAGAFWRYDRTQDKWTNLTPALADGHAMANYGFAGLATDAQRPGVLLVASLNRWTEGNQLWRSTDAGRTWQSRFDGATWDHAGVAYAKRLTPHWMVDVAIDPHDGRRAWFVTGYGVWTTTDIAPTDGSAPHWRFANRGLEETVAAELISPPEGAPLLSALGDIGSFRHEDLATVPAAGALSPGSGTSTSIAFAGLAPARLVRTHAEPSHAALSDDGGLTWRNVAATPAAAREHGPGSLVINADASRLLWLPKGGHVNVSTDEGDSWHLTATDYTSPANHLTAHLAADRIDPLLVYLYDPADGRFLVSENGGESFELTQMFAPEGGILRAEPRRRGCVWMPTSDGLYISTRPGRNFIKLPAVAAAHQVGFGRAAPGADRDTVYLNGRIGDAEGLFRSNDSGATWTRIDDPAHRYGWLRVVIGDGQVYGRVYLGTSGRGVIVGEPARK